MATLCIDIATEHGMVAVSLEGQPTSSARWTSKGRHGENLFAQIETAMASAGVGRADLSLVGAGIGPGAFTSLRVGLATAKGVALGLDLPLVGVSSLRVLARSIGFRDDLVCVPSIPAYRGDVFAAAYLVSREGIDVLREPFFGAPDAVFESIREAADGRRVAVRGQAVSRHAELLEQTFGSNLHRGSTSPDPATPDALVEEVRFVANTDGYADLATLEPSYLRASDAKLPNPPLRTQRSD